MATPLTKREKELCSLANDFHLLCIMYRNEMSFGGKEPSPALIREGAKLERRKAKLISAKAR